MSKKVDRLIIDTNLWISFLIKKDFKKLDDKIKSGKVKLIFSVELLDEFLTVAARPKLRRFFDATDLEQLISLFDVYGEIVSVNSKTAICRDPKDNFLLALSKDSNADFLLTGDDDLLELRHFGTTRIMKIADYLKRPR